VKRSQVHTEQVKGKIGNRTVPEELNGDVQGPSRGPLRLNTIRYIRGMTKETHAETDQHC